jgi:hypothetical protein
MAGFFEGAGQINSLGCLQHVNYAASHTPGRTCNNYLDHRSPVLFGRGSAPTTPVKVWEIDGNYFTRP